MKYIDPVDDFTIVYKKKRWYSLRETKYYRYLFYARGYELIEASYWDTLDHAEKIKVMDFLLRTKIKRIGYE